MVQGLGHMHEAGAIPTKGGREGRMEKGREGGREVGTEGDTFKLLRRKTVNKEFCTCQAGQTHTC